jgi:hypothetical protein
VLEPALCPAADAWSERVSEKNKFILYPDLNNGYR